MATLVYHRYFVWINFEILDDLLFCLFAYGNDMVADPASVPEFEFIYDSVPKVVIMRVAQENKVMDSNHSGEPVCFETVWNLPR
mgnify:CR=1 FL=1